MSSSFLIVSNFRFIVYRCSLRYCIDLAVLCHFNNPGWWTWSTEDQPGFPQPFEFESIVFRSHYSRQTGVSIPAPTRGTNCLLISVCTVPIGLQAMPQDRSVPRSPSMSRPTHTSDIQYNTIQYNTRFVMRRCRETEGTSAEISSTGRNGWTETYHTTYQWGPNKNLFFRSL